MPDKDSEKKQAFVSQADRPEVRIKADTPVADLRVRDLVAILGAGFGLGTGKDFWDGKDWQKDDFDGTNKPWKEGKEFKDKEKEKDFKDGKEKAEKLEKPEIKEFKAEKLELDGVFEPAFQRGPDPRLDQVIQALSGLTAKVAQLSDQVAEMKKAGKG